MGNEPKLLPSTPPLPDVAELEPMRFADGTELSYRRLEVYHETRLSISPEVAHARMQEAHSVSEQARYEFAVPAVEKTKQVRIIGIVVALVALGGFVAACIRPEAAASIATIAAIVTGVFGGMYALEQLRKKP